MSQAVLQSAQFYPPLEHPNPHGLYAATNWGVPLSRDPAEPAGDDAIPRWLDAGVLFRRINYQGEWASGVWGAPWCRDPEQTSGDEESKYGIRPQFPGPFEAVTVWAYDECDPTLFSQAEILERVQQTLRLQEQVNVETMLAARMVADLEAIPGQVVHRPTVHQAVGYLEGLLAKTNTTGLIHASPEAAAVEYGIVLPVRSGVLQTPLGHQWVFGGGYVDGLQDLLVATSRVYGWRNAVQVRPVYDQYTYTIAAIAERSVVIGYEQIMGAVYTESVETSGVIPGGEL